jgi:hypothetical protein
MSFIVQAMARWIMIGALFLLFILALLIVAQPARLAIIPGFSTILNPTVTPLPTILPGTPTPSPTSNPSVSPSPSPSLSPTISPTASPRPSTAATTNSQVRVTRPLPGSTVTSPLSIAGTAPGPWYFEASFPIELVTSEGTVIGQGYATAQGNWMTEQQVPFTAQLTFTKPSTKQGMLVFKKANASGLPINDDSLEIPVLFE